MRLPLQRIGVNNEEICAASKTSIKGGVYTWGNSCQHYPHNSAQQTLKFILMLDFLSEDVNDEVVCDLVFAMRHLH